MAVSGVAANARGLGDILPKHDSKPKKAVHRNDSDSCRRDVRLANKNGHRDDCDKRNQPKKVCKTIYEKKLVPTFTKKRGHNGHLLIIKGFKVVKVKRTYCTVVKPKPKPKPHCDDRDHGGNDRDHSNVQRVAQNRNDNNHRNDKCDNDPRGGHDPKGECDHRGGGRGDDDGDGGHNLQSRGDNDHRNDNCDNDDHDNGHGHGDDDDNGHDNGHNNGGKPRA
jgi:hypothetical protein